MLTDVDYEEHVFARLRFFKVQSADHGTADQLCHMLYCSMCWVATAQCVLLNVLGGHCSMCTAQCVLLNVLGGHWPAAFFASAATSAAVLAAAAFFVAACSASHLLGC
jgi:hypothetical protein